MEEQSDTPMTDAAVYIASDYDDVVSVDFARDLERELAAATRERDEARASEASALGLVSRVRQALGDNGKLMQDELIAHCRTLAGMPEALRAVKLEAASLADAQVIAIALEALAARADNEPNRLPSHRCSSLCSPDETFCAITKDGKCDAMDRSCDAALAATEPNP